jgi:heme A synthase
MVARSGWWLAKHLLMRKVVVFRYLQALHLMAMLALLKSVEVRRTVLELVET